jgi:xanthine dehydrogenase YagR molybdenum-binding subunit
VHFKLRITSRIGRVRVFRIVSVFDCGRILNPKAAHSQFMGGIVFGISQVLQEFVCDRATHLRVADFIFPQLRP